MLLLRLLSLLQYYIDEELEELVDSLLQEVVDDEEKDNNDMTLPDDTLTEDGKVLFSSIKFA